MPIESVKKEDIEAEDAGSEQFRKTGQSFNLVGPMSIDDVPDDDLESVRSDEVIGQYNALVKHREENTRVAHGQGDDLIARFDWGELDEESGPRARRRCKDGKDAREAPLRLVYEEDLESQQL